MITFSFLKLLLLHISIIAIISCSDNTSTPPDDNTQTYPGYNLVWSDEFNTDGAPDSNKWGYNTGTGTSGWGNNELQYYTNRSKNVIVESGLLKIKLIKEDYMGSAYTSARLLSQGKYDFKYGKIDCY